MTDPQRQVVFGPFRLLPARHVLLRGEQPVRLGGRAWDILAVLLERPGQVVTKRELIARVWPHTFVDDANLRVHIAALRRALADADGSAGRYISNVAGRGYSFTEHVAISEDRPAVRDAAALAPAPAVADAPPPDAPPPDAPPLDRPTPEPARPASRMVGRSAVVRTIAGQLSRYRFCTIVGPGGIGKTTVAVAVADEVLGQFHDGIHFVDLAPVADPSLVPTALAAVLGVGVVSEQPGHALSSYLRDRHLLIVLDNCEHVVEAAATLATTVFRAGPGVHLLATSREPLRADGERVHRLPPLGSPPVSPRLSAADALGFPAVQLFVDRAMAKLDITQLADSDAPYVADICRRLDGIPLAIEIAAGWVDAFGIAGLAALLDNRFGLQMRGRRTALPRHKTLFTALDWSYVLLAERERAVLRGLTVFAGVFTINAAIAVLPDDDYAPAEIIDAIVSLIDKSLIAANVDGAVAEYRLLESTRAYGSVKLAESGGADRLARRHALYVRRLLEGARDDWETRPAAEWLEGHRHLLEDVRTALDWSFGPTGDSRVGVALTIAAEPLWFQLSLINEGQVRAQRARDALPKEPTADAEAGAAMRLDTTIAWSLMQNRGFVAETRTAWSRVLDGAERLADADHQLRALWGLWAGRVNGGDLNGALALARRFNDIAARQPDGSDLCVADRMLGWTLHLLGDQPAARLHIERMLRSYVVPVTGARIIRFVFDQRITAQCFLARILWLQGFADQAMRVVEDVVAALVASEEALSLCQAGTNETYRWYA